ncbi:AMP-binding protein [Shimwellia pseudoproteus]|nr:AMP-binding protein [Shimwellia pseudoproteus]
MRLGEPLHAGEQAVAYRRRSFQLAPAQWAQFRGLARQHGVTPTAVALAILGGIARRYGGQQHSRITLTVLDRQALTGDVMRIIGDFTSTLLLALDSATAQSVVAAAGAAQQQVFSALDHQALSGIEVLRLLPGEQRATPIVLTSTLGMPATPGDGVVNQLQQGLSQTPQVLLDIQLSESAGAMAVVWDSRDGSYPEPVLSAAFHDFCTALTALSGDPARWQQAALRPAPLAISAPQLAHTAGGGNICAPFCQLARQAPHNIALIHGELQLTRGALLSHAGHWRDTLLAMGARPGDAVAISLPPGVAQVSAQLGALLAGCAFVPLDPEWPAARQQAILTTLAQARPGHQVHLITPQSVDLRYGAQPGNAAGAVTASLAGENDCAYIIFTSGSTGTPKGVPITHGQALTTLNAMQQMLGLHDGDRVLGVSRPSFDLAIFNLFGLLNAGGVLVIPRAGTMPDADAWWLDIIQHRVTLWNSVPAQLQLLLDSPPQQGRHRPVRLAGGAALRGLGTRRPAGTVASVAPGLSRYCPRWRHRGRYLVLLP